MSALGDILVLGLGSSGEAAASYCASLLGTEVDSVTAADSGADDALRERATRLEALGVRVHVGVDRLDGEYETTIASPGIPPHAPLMVSARGVSQRVVSEIEFAWERSTVPWVAITGTNGKTTTTALVAHLMTEGGVAARPVGNIGPPAITAVLKGGPDVLVAEVSSFQLALTQRFHPRVAVVLNITPDHVDWHGSLESYVADKSRILANLDADDVAVIDVDDEGSARLVEAALQRGARVVRVSREELPGGGAGLVGGVLTLSTSSGPVELVSADELLIRGPHNVSNALAAAAAAHAMGVGITALRCGLRCFEPIEHRLEPVGEACGAEWFNDSKATNPDAVLKALAAFGDRPLVLLLGGRNKNNDMRPLAHAAAQRALSVVCFGEAGTEIAQAFETQPGAGVFTVAGLADAVAQASELAVPGGAVVLSPACASFDEFSNYEQRGRAFKDLVARLECEES
ncbi:MAG: UDP-N-acetylmuramoyl-L-alanine--D-glutamate ligase [Coriobacteriia bacterium]|nr:UDP-N-acetylmuramoyl-L-alanine--D-glutamate ligase [Coriobacteriia bacterium]